MSLQGFSSDKTPTTCKKVTIGLQLATGTPVEGEHIRICNTQGDIVEAANASK